LWPLWPTAISYAVSYLFLVSLLPFATAWIARTTLASSPVVFYAGLFVPGII
jgi:TMEM175 potassium channel family protein